MVYIEKSCICIGNFDGIHIGHDKLIKEMLAISKRKSLEPVILTFKYSSSNLRKSTHRMKCITGFDKKIELLHNRYKCKVVYVDLNPEVQKLSPEEFIKQILCDRLNACEVVVGFDYRFGYKASGNTEDLKKFESKYGYISHVMDEVQYNGEKISSSVIRQAIKDGDIRKVNRLIVGNYTIYNNRLTKTYGGKYILNKDVEMLYPKDGTYKVNICGLITKIRIETLGEETYIYTNNVDLTCDLIFVDY